MTTWHWRTGRITRFHNRVEAERHPVGPVLQRHQLLAGPLYEVLDNKAALARFSTLTPAQPGAQARLSEEAGLLPSMGTVGTCFENALVASFWSRVQVGLLDRQVWSTRLELGIALFEYLEIFHNRQRRHSSLGTLTPFEFETRHGSLTTSTVA